MFDQLSWTWHYEPLDFNGWIPDFLLVSPHPEQILVEVKPITAIDLVTVAKIERALGYQETDEATPICSGYEVLLVGAIAPVKSDYDHNSIGWITDDCYGGWCNTVINEPEAGVFGLTAGGVGRWHDRILEGRPHKEALRPIHCDWVADMWAAATNNAQWKPSR